MLTLKQINKELIKVHPSLELVKGTSYYYFVIDDGILIFETKMVMVKTLNSLTIDSWINEAKYFVESFK